MLYFENTNGGASKFWQLILVEDSVNVEREPHEYETHWGRIGTRGSSKRKSFRYSYDLIHLLQSKRNKGYRFLPERSEFITEGGAARLEDSILRNVYGARGGYGELTQISQTRSKKIAEKKEEVVEKKKYERKKLDKDPTLRRIDDLLDDL